MAAPITSDDDSPRRQAGVPDQPLFQGVLGFPLQGESLKPWVLVSLALMMLALIAVSFRALISILPEDISNGFAMLVYRGSWHVFTGLTLFAILFSFYPSACFLAVVQDSAAGAEEVQWPTDLWFEFAWKLLFMVWLALASLALAALLLAVLAPFVATLVWWCTVLALGAVLFPIVVLSTLVGGAPYVVFHHEVLLRLLRDPLTALVLYLYTIVILVPCLGLGVWIVAQTVWWATPWVGLWWGTNWLIYARVLGRVGWVLDGGPRKKKKKRKKKRPVEPDEAGA
ncbi:MAG: hypothetical protein AB7K24_07660 [Gemmataceae bacterium]